MHDAGQVEPVADQESLQIATKLIRALRCDRSVPTRRYVASAESLGCRRVVAHGAISALISS